MCTGIVSGRSVRKTDYVVMGGTAGWGTLVGQTAEMKVTGGLTAGLHLGYEYREGRFWFGSGGEVQYFGSGCASDITVPDVYFEDTRMMVAKMHYAMNSQRTEQQNWGRARIWVSAGYCTGNHNTGGFYVGGGLRFGGKFDISNSTRVKYTTSAEYERYIEEYEDMPNHFYTVNDVEDTVSFGTMFDMAVMAEVGWDLKVSKCNRLKVGLFVEAGLNNIMDGVTTREPFVDEKNVTIVKPYSAYNGSGMTEKYVVPVEVGVKVSFLFNVSRINQRCRTCPCYRKR